MIGTLSLEEATQIRMSRKIDGKYGFAQPTNGRYATENLIRPSLKMES